MLDSVSAASKIGWLGLIGGTFLALVKTVRWVANFSEEHTRLMVHLVKAEPMLVEFALMRESVRVAKEERNAIIEELRGLRQEINEVLKLMVTGYQRGE